MMPELDLYGDAQSPSSQGDKPPNFINFHTQEWASPASLSPVKLAMVANQQGHGRGVAITDTVKRDDRLGIPT